MRVIFRVRCSRRGLLWLPFGMHTGERVQVLASAEALHARVHARMSNRTSNPVSRDHLRVTRHQLP